MKTTGERLVKAVAFDVDGTFYTNARMYFRSLPWGIRNWSLVQAFSKARLLLRTMRPIDDYYALQAELTGKILGLPAQEAEARIRQRIYTDWEQSLSGIRLVPGLKNAIETFKARKLPVGVLSDFPVASKLGILGLDSLFDFVLSAETVGYLKPNPESFLALAQGLGVDPENILYVGNSYRYDIIGAQNAGMMSAHFSRKFHKNGCANITFNSYEKLKNWVLENS